MRLNSLGTVLLATVLALPSVASAQMAADAWPHDAGEPLRLAQAEPEERGGIFEHLQIELSDLEELSARADEILQGNNTVRMSLDDAVQQALKANQDILIISYETDIALADIQSARGDFDPTLSGSATLQDSSQPASPETFVFGGISSIDDRVTNYQLALGGLTPFGTTYELSYGATRTIGTFTGDMSEYAVGTTLTVRQPLLRGIGKRSNLARLRIAKNAHGISEAEVERITERTIGEVVKAYWDLVGTIENLRVRQESLANANRLVEINEQRLAIGTAAAIEVLQAKAGAASRVSDLITARTLVDNAEDSLKQLVGMQDGELFSSNHIVPVEQPQVRPVDWNLARSMELAIQNRAEILTAELRIESAELERRRARNSLLPRFDITSSYTRNDRSFEFDDAMTGIRENDGNRWMVGVEGSIPLGNWAARGDLRRSELVLRQNEQRYLKSQQDIMLEVRIALRAAISSEVLVESTRQTRILEEANVAAEEKRLQLGVTTSQDLLDRQEDLTEAQVEEVRALVNFERALIDLQVAEGTLLEKLGVGFDPQS